MFRINTSAMMFNFENSYLKLNQGLFSFVKPTKVKRPQVVLFNNNLAEILGLNLNDVSEQELADYFSGNTILEGAEPIAQAYAGHQFGGFTNLGDGRAILLGEHLTPANKRVDIQLKGSGPTPYSRRGDGRASVSAMLREYIMSEAMFSLGIPTTRSLGVVSTGEEIYRQRPEPGAVLTRIADSHIRVGTFEFIANSQMREQLQAFTEYALKRHYPTLLHVENKALALLNKVMEQQVDLIVNWMRVGFIHGVMNTDNMSIAGETIDYGPCAFMNIYHPETVFSSIDRNKRYAFSKQPDIAFWNITRFAEALLPIIDEDIDVAVEKAKEVLGLYGKLFNDKWLKMMANKLGILDITPGDELLINDLLKWMQENKVDYTNTFIQLSAPNFNKDAVYERVDFKEWENRWKKRIACLEGGEIPKPSIAIMQKTNPAYIPRNHKVEEALFEAQHKGDLKPATELLNGLKKVYNYEELNDEYQSVPDNFDDNYQTFCGT